MAIALRVSAQTGMTLREMERIAQPLRVQYDLDFNLGLSHAKNRYGLCSWRGGKVSILISRDYSVHGLTADIKDTLLHEIAHALAGPYAHHGPLWQEWCVKIGAKPIRCGNKDTEAMSERKRQRAAVIGACRCAKDKHTMTRQPKGKYNCRICRTEITWTSNN